MHRSGAKVMLGATLKGRTPQRERRGAAWPFVGVGCAVLACSSYLGRGAVQEYCQEECGVSLDPSGIP